MISFMQMILILGGAVTLAVAVNGVPAIWSFILPWLRPPYLHLVTNGIIIAIAAASRFRRIQTAPPVRSQHLISVRTPPPAFYAAYSSSPEVRAAAADESGDRVVELKPVMVNGVEVEADAEGVVAEDDGESALAGRILTYDTQPLEILSSEFRLEYFPPANPTGDIREGERVVRRETMESSRKKKGVETSRAAHEDVRHGGAPRPTPDHLRYSTRKSKSFKERTVYIDSPPSHAIRKEASPSPNKLNRRVDQFHDVSVDRSATYSPEFQADYLLPENPYENISERDREEEYETMESAWKKITEGASRAADQEVVPAKSSSLTDDSAASGAIGKEVSPNEDELNRRVEAFIKKVNDEIRLRRQKSLDQFIHLNSAA